MERAVSSRGRLLSLGAALVFLAATIGLTWPLAVRLDTHIPGDAVHPGVQGDLFFQWNLERQMREGRFPVHTRSPYINYPVGQAFEKKVAFSGFQAAYVALMLFFDLLPAHNLTALAFLFLNGWCAWLLLRERSSSAAFALAGALLFGFGPFVIFKLDQGFVQKIFLFPIPLFVRHLLRLLERPRRRDAVLAGIYFVILLLDYPPFGIYDLMFGGVLLVGSLLHRRPPARALRPLLWLLVLLAPAFGLLLWVGWGDRLFSGAIGVEAGGHYIFEGYADLLNPFRFFPYRGLFDVEPWRYVVELPLGLPVIPLLLALLAAWRRRPYARTYLAIAGLFTLLMGGPYLTSHGTPVRVLGKVIPLPFYLIARSPFGVAFRMPIRLMPWIVLALLLGAAQAFDLVVRGVVRRWGPGAARAVAGALALVLVVEPQLLLPEYHRALVTPLPRPAFCEATAGESFQAVIHFPYFGPTPHMYEFFAMLCDRSTVNAGFERPPPVAIPLPIAPPEEKREFLAWLDRNDVRYILFHPAYYEGLRPVERPEPTLGPPEARFSAPDVERWLERFCGPPRRFPEDGVLAFRVPEAGGGSAGRAPNRGSEPGSGGR